MGVGMEEVSTRVDRAVHKVVLRAWMIFGRRDLGQSDTRAGLGFSDGLTIRRESRVFLEVQLLSKVAAGDRASKGILPLYTFHKSSERNSPAFDHLRQASRSSHRTVAKW